MSTSDSCSASNDATGASSSRPMIRSP